MEKVKKAAALKYEKGYNTPIVTAAGVSHIAEKIIEKAKESNVPVLEDEDLANFLMNVDIGSEIPYELYEAVAKVIAYVMDVDSKENEKGRL